MLAAAGWTWSAQDPEWPARSPSPWRAPQTSHPAARSAAAPSCCRRSDRHSAALRTRLPSRSPPADAPVPSDPDQGSVAAVPARRSAVSPARPAGTARGRDSAAAALADSPARASADRAVPVPAPAAAACLPLPRDSPARCLASPAASPRLIPPLLPVGVALPGAGLATPLVKIHAAAPTSSPSHHGAADIDPAVARLSHHLTSELPRRRELRCLELPESILLIGPRRIECRGPLSRHRLPELSHLLRDPPVEILYRAGLVQQLIRPRQLILPEAHRLVVYALLIPAVEVPETHALPELLSLQACAEVPVAEPLIRHVLQATLLLVQQTLQLVEPRRPECRLSQLVELPLRLDPGTRVLPVRPELPAHLLVHHPLLIVQLLIEKRIKAGIRAALDALDLVRQSRLDVEVRIHEGAVLPHRAAGEPRGLPLERRQVLHAALRAPKVLRRPLRVDVP